MDWLYLIDFFWKIRMMSSDLDDFIPPAPSMQAPGLPPSEAAQWDTYGQSQGMRTE